MRRISMTLAAVATAAALLPALPADAATTTWKVANPNSNGTWKATAPRLTLRNAAGDTLFTCENLTLEGQMQSKTYTKSSPMIGMIMNGDPVDCDNGYNVQFPRSGWYSGLGANGYNTATGTTSIDTGIYQYFITSPDCTFITENTALTYTNGTSTLKMLTADAVVGTNTDGSPNCAGTVANGEKLTLDVDFKVTPAITITAKTS
jgi:hypothetical protein